jgi:two-component system, chemotaxis family, sensor kinase CheA
MSRMDPTEVFRQEARELLDQLELTLLDLGEAPGDRDLVDSAFRALHTIKGSGAMFGFDEVASFVHQFETAFDQVRKGTAPINPSLVKVALAAKDHIARLIAEPGRHGADGEAILKQLRMIVGSDQGDDPCDPIAVAGSPTAAGTAGQAWRIRCLRMHSRSAPIRCCSWMSCASSGPAR